MKKYVHAIVVCSAIMVCTGSKTQDHYVGARQAGMSNCGVGEGNINSFFSNPAGLTSVQGVAASLSAENRYVLKELNTYAAVAGMPILSGVFAAGVRYSGYAKYHRDAIGFGYAKQLGRKFSAGMQFNYCNTYIAEGYIGGKGILWQGGWTAQPVKDVYIGSHVAHSVSLNKNEPDLFLVNFSAGIMCADKVFVAAEAEKQLQQKTIFRTGIEYSIHKKVFLRTGISTNPAMFSFGFGYKLKSLQADISFADHRVLGIVSQITIIYERGKK